MVLLEMAFSFETKRTLCSKLDFFISGIYLIIKTDVSDQKLHVDQRKILLKSYALKNNC